MSSVSSREARRGLKLEHVSRTGRQEHKVSHGHQHILEDVRVAFKCYNVVTNKAARMNSSKIEEINKT